MKDKKRLKLSICGKAVPGDEITDINQANILARARSENVRDFLVKELKITPDRIYICQSDPETDPDAKARVELEF